MSRERRSAAATELRLLGAPVQLASRDGGAGGRRSRPRSAATRSHTPDHQERSRRPFSADTKSNPFIIRNMLTSPVQYEYHLDEWNEVKAVPPTANLLKNHNHKGNNGQSLPKELRCNSSDHGSEDTHASLGTKIKAKAQGNTSRRKVVSKNYLKYRDIARKEQKEQTVDQNKDDNLFDFKITILQATEELGDEGSLSEKHSEEEDYKTMSYESFFMPLDSKVDTHPDSLAGRVSFGNGALHSEMEQAIEAYSRRLPSKQQLSLVEEESNQDLESQPCSSLSPQGALVKTENKLNNEINPNSDCGSYTVESKPVVENQTMDYNVLKNDRNSTTVEIDLHNGPRTYNSFYDDFIADRHKRYGSNNNSLSCTTMSLQGTDYKEVHRSSDLVTAMPSSYHTSGASSEDCLTKVVTSIDNNSNIKSDGEVHSSLECIALDNMTESRNHKLSPRLPCRWNESPGHSRLLCNEFISIKDTDEKKTLKLDTENIETKFTDGKTEEVEIKEEYPEYLSNSISKAYTSKILEDYKKEIRAIDNLHELTLKDIKTDTISPTPLNIDVLFEQIEGFENGDTKDSQIKKYDNLSKLNKKECNKNSHMSSKSNEIDISNISTRELIQNYFKVKAGEPKTIPKSIKKKMPEQSINVNSGHSAPETSINSKMSWNSTKNGTTLSKPKNTTVTSLTHQKKNNKVEENHQIPLSSRFECVQTDKDVDSWISMAAATPKNEYSAHNNSLASTTMSDVTKDNQSDTTFKISITAEEKLNAHGSREAAKPNVNEITEPNGKSGPMDINSMLNEIDNFACRPVQCDEAITTDSKKQEEQEMPKDNFKEIFTFLENVEHSANEALSVVTDTAPHVVPKLEGLLRLSHTELAQRHVTAALQLEERSCCIALLQESLANHKEQMINKVKGLEKQSSRNIAKVKQDCEEAIKRHQSFIDQLISDKKTLNHRIEQLVEERQSLEERWRRSAQALEQRYRLELKNQHDRMAAAQQVAKQRWVRQKAEKIKELTVKGLEGELREMADRAAQETARLRATHAEALARQQEQHDADVERRRRALQLEHDAALARERQAAAARMEKQMVELEQAYTEQRARLAAELRAENERTAAGLAEQERRARADVEKWCQEQEKEMEDKMRRLDEDIASQREVLEEQLRRKRDALEAEFAQHKMAAAAEMQREVKRRAGEAAAAHKVERDREIERAIESMEAEAQRGRRDLQEALRRNKEQYETELRELGETEKATLKRYQEAQARVRQTEDKCAELEASVAQLESQHRALVERNKSLEARLEECSRSSEAAWRGRLEAARGDADQLRRTHDEQMHQLYAKVKVAVARKDSAIQALTREADKATEKITLLEQRLQQQRKDFLKHK